jgi:hypothetical protein
MAQVQCTITETKRKVGRHAHEKGRMVTKSLPQNMLKDGKGRSNRRAILEGG